jgi:hypothetical protein
LELNCEYRTTACAAVGVDRLQRLVVVVDPEYRASDSNILRKISVKANVTAKTVNVVVNRRLKVVYHSTFVAAPRFPSVHVAWALIRKKFSPDALDWNASTAGMVRAHL